MWRRMSYQQGATPPSGSIFTADGKMHRIKLESQYPAVRKIIGALTGWQGASDRDEPAVILNRHCVECPFQTSCREIALREDNLTLLRGLTRKKLQQYHKKGIFTVTQLSYQFRPRKSRSRGRKQPIRKPELQALALRTEKSFLRFLLSGGRDVDAFDASKRKKN
jgi:predicted RecB family nuclease